MHHMSEPLVSTPGFGSAGVAHALSTVYLFLLSSIVRGSFQALGAGDALCHEMAELRAFEVEGIFDCRNDLRTKGNFIC
jgi:hypothetical protein